MQKIETTIELLRDMAETESREEYKVTLDNAANLLEGNPTSEMLEAVAETVKDLMPGFIKAITAVLESIADTLHNSEMLPLIARAVTERVFDKIEEDDDEQPE